MASPAAPGRWPATWSRAAARTTTAIKDHDSTAARTSCTHILAVNADAVAAYLNAQIGAGAQAVMIFDSWGGVLADGAFQAFSLAYTRAMLAGGLTPAWTARTCHRIVFTKGGSIWLRRHEAARPVLGLDWTANLGQARAIAGSGRRQGAAGAISTQRVVCPARAVGTQGTPVLDSFGPAHRQVHHRAPRISSTWATASPCWCIPIRPTASCASKRA